MQHNRRQPSAISDQQEPKGIKSRAGTLVACGLLLAACCFANTAFAKDKNKDKAHDSGKGKVQQPTAVHLDHEGEKWAQKTLARMTLQEKVGQMLMVWAPAEFLNVQSPEYRHLLDDIHKYHLGGFGLTVPEQAGLLMKSEPYAAAALINQLQQESDLPLLIAADFERGLAMRLNGVTAFPHSMAFGAAGKTEYAEAYGRIVAQEARAIGVEWNWFPVADVNSNPLNPIINTRAFSGDPTQTGELVAAYIRAARAGGLMTTAKHFPGHGDTDSDTHLGLARVEGDRHRLETVELPPFQAAIAAGVDAIMVGHITVPALDPDPTHVATNSPVIIHDLLQKQLGFQGIVISDALDMNGFMRLYQEPVARRQASGGSGEKTEENPEIGSQEPEVRNPVVGRQSPEPVVSRQSLVVGGEKGKSRAAELVLVSQAQEQQKDTTAQDKKKTQDSGKNPTPFPDATKTEFPPEKKTGEAGNAAHLPDANQVGFPEKKKSGDSGGNAHFQDESKAGFPEKKDKNDGGNNAHIPDANQVGFPEKKTKDTGSTSRIPDANQVGFPEKKNKEDAGAAHFPDAKTGDLPEGKENAVKPNPAFQAPKPELQEEKKKEVKPALSPQSALNPFDGGVPSAHYSVLSTQSRNLAGRQPSTSNLLVEASVRAGSKLSTNHRVLSTGFLATSPSARAAVAAVKAGNDIALLPANIDGAYNGLLEAVRSGELSEAQIDASVLKILRAKASVGLHRARLVDLGALPRLVNSPENQAVGQQIADAAVTLVREDKGNLWQLPRVPGFPCRVDPDTLACIRNGTAEGPNAYTRVVETHNRIVAVVFTDDVRSEMGRGFEHELRARVPDASVMYIDESVAAFSADAVLATMAPAERVIVAVYASPQPGRVAGRSSLVAGQKAPAPASALTAGEETQTTAGTSLRPKQAALLQTMLQQAGDRAVVVAMGNPYLASDFAGVRTYLCTFSTTQVSEIAAVKALFGEIAIGGRLPVTIPGFAERGTGIDKPEQK